MKTKLIKFIIMDIQPYAPSPVEIYYIRYFKRDCDFNDLYRRFKRRRVDYPSGERIDFAPPRVEI